MLKFRYSKEQIVAYMNYMQEREREQLARRPDRVKGYIMRALTLSWCDKDSPHHHRYDISSLAEALDLPRETVRRKVGELIKDGFLARENHTIIMGGRFNQEVVEGIEERIDKLLAAAARIRQA